MHASQLQLAMHADNALVGEEHDSVAAHVDTCSLCQARLADLHREAQQIVSAIQMESVGEKESASENASQKESVPALVIPKFSRPTSLRGFALINVATGLVIWLLQFLWKTLFGELAISATNWAASVYLPDTYDLTTTTALYLLEEGTAMLDAYLGFIVATVLFVLFSTTCGFVLLRYKAGTTVGLCLLAATVGSIALPTPVNALDFRRDQGVLTIPATETINDTLIIGGETILIEGTITGDVVAAGRRIDVSGTINGNLLTFADSVNVSGKVGGMALGAVSSYTLDAATVAGDLWVAGRKINLNSDTEVSRNATFAARNTTVDGRVGKDLYAFSETVELSGAVGEDLEAFADEVQLLGNARVHGNARLRLSDEDKLYRSASSQVDGEVEFLDLPDEFEDKNHYTSIPFYIRQLAGLVAAFLAGLVLLWLVPGVRSMSIGASTEGLKSAGIGLLTLVSVPVMALLVAITLVGLPISLVAVFAWLLGLYLAKIVIASIVGQMLFSESNSQTLPLLAGLAIVMVAVNLPLLGGIINFLLTIAGLGLLVQFVFAWLSSRSTDHAAAA